MKELRVLFRGAYKYEEWAQVLGRCFGAREVMKEPVEIGRDGDGDDAWRGYYAGEVKTEDGYDVGFFVYEIRGGVAKRKVGLRNLVRQFVNERWGRYDAVVVVFYTESEWRVSLVCDLKRERTDAKRFTFVFGDEQETYATAVARFGMIEGKKANFERLREAFSVEALSKEFFNRYNAIYSEFCEYAYKYKDDARYFEFQRFGEKEIRDYVKLLLGRIVFLCFVQKKGWMNGDQNFLKNIFEAYCEQIKASGEEFRFLDYVLEKIFFECLNSPHNSPYQTVVRGYGDDGKISVPFLNSGLFECKDIDVPKSVFGEELWRSLFNLLGEYNFTIDENDPNDAEIGIDPEMLGRIFESQIEDNKDKGAFYTPKEIVQYMCRESIDAYLKANKESGKDELTLLKEIKVCDPAIGSGAFPMGILSDLYRRRIALGDKHGAETKKHIIENNIYGVDIEAGAVDIARLRFWLSIVVDLELPEMLPNFDYKIMQGNSLLEQYGSWDLSDLSSDSNDLNFYGDEEKKRLSALLNGYFNDHGDKTAHRSEITEQVKKMLKNKGVELKDDIKIDANTHFFLWHTWFADVFDKGGFDVVIGNPPYISAPAQIAHPQLAAQRERLVRSKQYETLYQKWDLYIPFMEKGLKLLSKGGSFAMIVPYPLSNQLYGKKFREWVLKNYEVTEIVDLNGIKVFENATVSNLILFVTVPMPKKDTLISFMNENKEIQPAFRQYFSDLVQDEKTKVWNLTQEKRETNRYVGMRVLGDYCYVSKGMVLNADEKTAKGEFTKDDLISEIKDKVHCREYVEAKDIERYAVKRVRFLEYNTDRVPNRVSRPTFRELYERNKLIFNRLGSLQVMIDDKYHFLQSDSSFMGILWCDLCGVENKSIASSIKKFSRMKREAMEELSKTVDLKYLLGIMNSKYASVLLANQRGGDYHIYPEHIRNIPIPQATKEQQSPIIALVEKILSKKKEDAQADTSAEEREIDRLVYGLYGLTDEEISVVEGR